MKKLTFLFAILIAFIVSACAFSRQHLYATPMRTQVTEPTTTPSLSSIATDTRSLTSTPAATTSPTPPLTYTPTLPAEITISPSSTYASLTIIGDSDFVAQTQMALSLLQSSAPDAFLKVETYVAIIERAEHSGMWAYENPPRYAVNDKTAFYSVTWYASTIAHDATHSELYHKYIELNGAPVPDDVWTGVAAERFCLAYQLDVLRRVGGPTHEVDYLEGQTGTHCDIDGDGDCDWGDYNGRDW